MAVGTTIDKRRRLASWLSGHGIEIGALHRPLPLPSGAQVTYVDRLPVDELRRHYAELASEPFAPVEIIGTADNLAAIADNSVDFIVANHLLEHLEDPIAGLLEFQRVLKPGGVLYMALPDSRVTFDRDRALTDSEHILEEHRQGFASNRLAHYLDWVIRVEKQRDDCDARVRQLMDMGYAIHFHVWTADTFLEFFYAARTMAGLDYELLAFAPAETPADDEFIVVMRKGRTHSLPVAPRAGGNSPVARLRAVGFGLRRRVARRLPGVRLLRAARQALRRSAGR